jgi:putative Mn2+ efflux pump MntP
MLGSVLLFGFLAGLDHPPTGSAIGFLPTRRRQNHFLAAAFTVFETMAPLVGQSVGHLLLRYVGGTATRIGLE